MREREPTGPRGRSGVCLLLFIAVSITNAKWCNTWSRNIVEIAVEGKSNTWTILNLYTSVSPPPRVSIGARETCHQGQSMQRKGIIPASSLLGRLNACPYPPVGLFLPCLSQAVLVVVGHDQVAGDAVYRYRRDPPRATERDGWNDCFQYSDCGCCTAVAILMIPKDRRNDNRQF